MEIRIYVANLAAYNAGHLVGEWIDLPLDEDELKERLNAILNAWNDGYSPSEEVAIHDYEAPFTVSEYTPPHVVNEWAQRIEDSGEDDEDVIKAVLGNWCDVEDGITCLENREYRVWADCDDMGDVAAAWLDETGTFSDVPDAVMRYFDYDAYGRDMEIEGTFIRYDASASNGWKSGYIEITR